MELQSKWVKAYTWFLAVFAFGAGITAYLAPDAMFSMVEVDWDTIRMISNGFAARNISVGIFALIAIFSNNRYIYLALFITRLSIDLQDMINGIVYGGEAITPVAAIASLGLLFILPLVFGILQIRKEFKA